MNDIHLHYCKSDIHKASYYELEEKKNQIFQEEGKDMHVCHGLRHGFPTFNLPVLQRVRKICVRLHIKYTI